MKRTELHYRVRQFMARYESFVLPVSQVPPFDVTEAYPTEIAGVKMATYTDWMKSCYCISLVGNPSMSVPAGFTADGLPIGLQIVGRYNDDWGLLQMGHAYEQAANLPSHLPPANGGAEAEKPLAHAPMEGCLCVWRRVF